jgi:hypothetical protein
VLLSIPVKRKIIARRAYSFCSGKACPGEARQSEDGSPEEKILSVYICVCLWLI